MFHFVMQVFPELGWKKLTPATVESLLNRLDAFTPDGPAASSYLRQHATRFGYFAQTGNAAAWTLTNSLILHPETELDDPRTMAILIHEVLHLQQPFSLRLSVQGELAAWQLEYQVYHTATGKWYGESDAPFNGSNTQWETLSRLSPNSRPHLAQAQRLMKEISPTYRSHLLPLYPLGREIWHKVTNRFQAKEKNG